MALQLQTARGGYPAAATNFFDFAQLDAFHHPEVLSVLYGDAWHSVLITDDQGQALLHSFFLQPLPDGQAGFDIEPFIGYAGPVLTTDSTPDFREMALVQYSEHCRSMGIVAEVVRFSPILANANEFIDSAQLQIFSAKDIIVAQCYADEAFQLASFQSKCRSSVKRGLRDCTAEMLDKDKDWDEFVAFYYASLGRINADKKWFYPLEVMARAAASDFFQVYVIRYQGEWASLSLVISHPLASYYFAAASGSQPVQGANEYLLFYIAQTIGKQGGKHLILGGGNSAAEDDPLLRFKRKFSQELTPLLMGRSVHDQEHLTKLITDAIAKRPEIAGARFFLKYRL